MMYDEIILPTFKASIFRPPILPTTLLGSGVESSTCSRAPQAYFPIDLFTEMKQHIKGTKRCCHHFEICAKSKEGNGRTYKYTPFRIIMSYNDHFPIQREKRVFNIVLTLRAFVTKFHCLGSLIKNSLALLQV